MKNKPVGNFTVGVTHTHGPEQMQGSHEGSSMLFAFETRLCNIKLLQSKKPVITTGIFH